MIKKLALILLLVGLGCYFIVAVTVLNRPNEGVVCSEVEVVIQDSARIAFLGPEEVLHLLHEGKCYPVGMSMENISLKEIEKVLLEHPYIEDVTGYKTPGGKLCVRIRQCTPVMHVMASDGSDYYLDRMGKVVPKSMYYVDMVVATGQITTQYAQRNLTRLGQIIQDSPFWSNQIQQINVSADGEIELIPRVGKHTILLGQPIHVEQKLERMRKFYTEGLNRVGWNKYSQVILKYENQIICKKKK